MNHNIQSPTSSPIAADILAEAEAALKRSRDAIARCDSYLKQLEQNLAKIETKNSQAQAALDAGIAKIVDEVDDATIKFIKDTE